MREREQDRFGLGLGVALALLSPMSLRFRCCIKLHWAAKLRRQVHVLTLKEGRDREERESCILINSQISYTRARVRNDDDGRLDR